jgi:hypothetical protein
MKMEMKPKVIFYKSDKSKGWRCLTFNSGD